MKTWLAKFWGWITNEENNRGLILLIMLTSIVVGFAKIQELSLELQEIKAETVEVKELFAPRGERLKIGRDSEGGALLEIVDTKNSIPSISLGGDGTRIESPGCIQVKIRDSREFLHLIATEVGDIAVWQKGACPAE